MILNDKQIRELCLTGPDDRRMIDPFTEKVSEGVISYGLNSFGYDIRLAEWDFYIFDYRRIAVIDPKCMKRFNTETRDPIQSDNRGRFLIPPNSYALGISVEEFNLPMNVIGVCVGKSTYARSGIIVNLTPLEPGWKGHLTIEVSNSNPLPVYVHSGEGIAQIIFFKGDLPDKSYSGKYQNQGDFINFSKV